ncbi:MAG: tRNA (guanosine(46)-N7)-methyltransferase TrmB [Firmicutes bacterium]|nr:tRNA (guanosine(46)-N7)-methyltransferase TrmB [Bacillota bacterium]
MRLRKIQYASSFINEHPEFMILDPENQKGKWQERFFKNQPIYIEIGCGKGQFIIEMAKMFPNINFIAIEKYDSVIIRVLEKVLTFPLPNLLLLQVDAEKIDMYFAKDEVSRIYLNFSDPWPKKRKEKKRLTNPLFLVKYKQILTNNSLIFFKSDNYSLFEYSMMKFNEDPDFNIILISLDLYHEKNLFNIQTEFEMKFVEMGKPIYYIQVTYEKELS